MMSAPELALAQALRNTLLADAGCRALLGSPPRIYDEQPGEPIYPFATLGDVQTRPADAASAEALDHAITLHAWSRHGGKSEALQVIAALRAALHDRAVAVSGRRLVLLLASFADVFRTGDGRSFHGVLRLRALTEPA